MNFLGISNSSWASSYQPSILIVVLEIRRREPKWIEALLSFLLREEQGLMQREGGLPLIPFSRDRDDYGD